MATESTKKDVKVLNIDQRLLEIQKSVRSLEKDAENKGFKYSYISGSKLLKAIRPAMDANGLTLTMAIQPETIEKSANAIFFLIRFVWTSVETGETREDLWPAYGSNNSLDKAIGCAYTYAERYYLLKKFHLGSDEDDVDAREPVAEDTTPTPTPAPTKKETVLKNKAPEDRGAEGVNQPKARVTLKQVQEGKAQSFIDYLASNYNAKSDYFDVQAIEYVKGRYDWDDDALYALLEEARKASFRTSSANAKG